MDRETKKTKIGGMCAHVWNAGLLSGCALYCVLFGILLKDGEVSAQDAWVVLAQCLLLLTSAGLWGYGALMTYRGFEEDL